MRIVLISQDDPFYLADNLSYLLKNLPVNTKVVGAIIADPSPFGKKENFYSKTLKTLKIFGWKFFAYYSLKYIVAKFKKNKRVKKILFLSDIPLLPIKGNINDKINLDIIKSYEPDLLISILGNQIFKEPLFNLASMGCINLHTALLPKYRGLMPTFWVLKNNEEYTGVSVFFVDKGIDSGPIIVQKKIKIEDRTQAQLIEDTKKIGMDAIIEAIQLINTNNVKLISNPDSEKTYYSFPTKEDVLDFNKKGKKFF